MALMSASVRGSRFVVRGDRFCFCKAHQSRKGGSCVDYQFIMGIATGPTFLRHAASIVAFIQNFILGWRFFRWTAHAPWHPVGAYLSTGEFYGVLEASKQDAFAGDHSGAIAEKFCISKSVFDVLAPRAENFLFLVLGAVGPGHLRGLNVRRTRHLRALAMKVVGDHFVEARQSRFARCTCQRWNDGIDDDSAAS